MNIYKFTKDSNFIKILSYELIYRWELVIKPGLNEDYKNIIKNLINLIINNKYLDIEEKMKLLNFIKIIE